MKGIPKHKLLVGGRFGMFLSGYVGKFLETQISGETARESDKSSDELVGWEKPETKSGFRSREPEKNGFHHAALLTESSPSLRVKRIPPAKSWRKKPGMHLGGWDPRTDVSYLGSPPCISAMEFAHLEGEYPILRGRKRSPWLLTTY